MDSNIDRKKNLLHNTILLSIGTIFTKCISLVMVVLYSRWLSAGAYGDFELYMTYISLLFPIATLSCGEAVFRYLLENNALKTRQRIITTALFISVCGFLVSVLIMLIFARRLLGTHFIQFFLLFAFETAFSMAQYCARGLHKLKYYAIAAMINSFAMSVSTTILVCFLHKDLSGLLYGYIIGYACAAIFCMIAMRLDRYINIKEISWEEAGLISKYSIPLIPNSIAWWIANGSDRTIIKICLGSEFNGIYSIANKVPSLCVTLFDVFHLSWQESTSDALQQDESPEKYFTEIYNKIVPLLFSASILVLSINFILFRYIFDLKYAAGYNHVAILTVATVLSFLSQFIGGIFIGLKKTAVNGLTTVLAAFVNIIVDIALIHHIGLYAASVSTLIAYLFLFIARKFLIHKIYKLKLNGRSYIYIALFGYFIISQYMNQTWLNYVNMVFASVIFAFSARTYIRAILKKILRK